MKTTRKENLLVIALLAAVVFTTTITRAADPLPERIATFDNDGPLQREQPIFSSETNDIKLQP